MSLALEDKLVSGYPNEPAKPNKRVTSEAIRWERSSFPGFLELLEKGNRHGDVDGVIPGVVGPHLSFILAMKEYMIDTLRCSTSNASGVRK